MRFYVHGAGRGGREAWPEQSEVGVAFADHSDQRLMTRKADVVSEQRPNGNVVVVAHSLGAVPTALALLAGDLDASRVVLLEPALYDVARGNRAVELHIAAMAEARACAVAGDLFGYWEIVAPSMFGRPATHDRWHEDQGLAQRFADMDPPWGHGVDGSEFSAIPTLVVTGAWNEEYEGIAQQLGHVGAEHVRLAGAKHRPQDHPDFEAVVADFMAGNG